MSTEIKTIKGSCHKDVLADFEVKHAEAELHLTRFYNGKDRGRNLQLTVQQHDGYYGTSYIHLTEEQCKELGQTLLECFDDTKYPSE